MKVKVHRALCEANGVCSRFAPSVYQLDADGYIDLHLVEVTPDLEEAALFGAAACPARAITVLIGLPSHASPGAEP